MKITLLLRESFNKLFTITLLHFLTLSHRICIIFFATLQLQATIIGPLVQLVLPVSKYVEVPQTLPQMYGRSCVYILSQK